LNRDAMLELARRGELYPAVILHGGREDERRETALALARTLLCERAPAARPCGACRHCRRIVWPGGRQELFHPDFQVLERDLRTSTSVDAARALLVAAQVSPFEARGQVFVIGAAETLSNEAANALLKVLEEPPVRAPRHFLLLAPSRLDLLPTLRSRSLSVYLGPADPLDPEQATALAARFGERVRALAQSRAPIHLLSAAAELAGTGGFEDARASRPWATAAYAVRLSADAAEPAVRRRLLDLAEALLGAAELRLRGIPAERILEGLVARHLAVLARPTAG
jgi:hypothetical protein